MDLMPLVGRIPGYRVIVSGVLTFSTRRAFGLSAEAAFWATFTLPWLILGLVSASAGVAEALGTDVKEEVRDTLLDGASRVLTQETVTEFVVPLVDAALQSTTGLTVFGLLAGLWSGSRIFATIAEGSVVLNGDSARAYVHTRGLGLAIYLLGLATVGAIVFTVVRWPDVWSTVVGIAPGPSVVYWVGVGLVLMVAVTTTIMFVADPLRSTWWRSMPGGALAVALWVLGSWGLQIYFEWVVTAESFYGAIAAPIAVMLWILVSTLSVFIGITVNATLTAARRGEYLTLPQPAPEPSDRRGGRDTQEPGQAADQSHDAVP